MGNTSRLNSRPAGSKMPRGAFMRASVALPAAFKTDDLVEALSDQLCQDAILQFMKDLDDRVCDLSFTKALAAHFTGLVKRERAGNKKAKSAS